MAEWRVNNTRITPNNSACVIFIHGFQGSPTDTWGKFPQLLGDDECLQSWDVLSFGYESNLAPNLTGIWEGDPSIKTIADSLGTFATTNLEKYSVLVLIAHSMGGLVVQRALLDHKKLTNKVDKVVLFGTPSFGLVKAWLFQLPILNLLNHQVSDMGKTSPFITTLRNDWSARFGEKPPFGFLAVAGSEDEFVTRTASLSGFPENQCSVVPGNHLQIVKPDDSNDSSLKLVLSFLKGETQPTAHWDIAALAIERRKFQQVMNRLGPNRSKLDKQALVDLAIAMDGLGKRTEAIEVLGDAERIGTDAMGTLAGRYKRAWLQDRMESDAKSALGLYRDAYTISIDKNPAQAYYHGINLAFLALVYEQDLAKAKQLANEALNHCQDAALQKELPGDSMWRLATQGEANLILGNDDLALEHYQQALNGPPKPEPWQFVSTTQQALCITDRLGNDQIARNLLALFSGL